MMEPRRSSLFEVIDRDGLARAVAARIRSRLAGSNGTGASTPMVHAEADGGAVGDLGERPRGNETSPAAQMGSSAPEPREWPLPGPEWELIEEASASPAPDAPQADLEERDLLPAEATEPADSDLPAEPPESVDLPDSTWAPREADGPAEPSPGVSVIATPLEATAATAEEETGPSEETAAVAPPESPQAPEVQREGLAETTLGAASEELGVSAVPGPHGTYLWRLSSPALPVYRCSVCGSDWLQPCVCCGQQAHEATAFYYVASGSGPSPAPEFSVIMLTKNNLALTRIAVESLRRAAGDQSIEFVFVDGRSTDGSLNYFRDLAAREAVRVIVTHPDEPFIYARNANRGAEAARGKFLLFANNDIEARDPDLFAKLARGLMDPRIAVLGTLTDYDCGNELQAQAGLPAECVWSLKPVMGFLWGVRAEVFAELGGLDEAFEDYGCDEVELQYRAIRRNYRLAVVDSRVHHEVHATFGGSIIPGLTRNIERFNRKHNCRLIVGGEWYIPFRSHVYPRVSVAMACRNYGRFLPRALESVLGSYLPAGTGLQVVVVNDASTDETAGILEQYRHRCPEQVNVIHQAVSRGPAAAKNQAIARCIGDYVALLDADDEFLTYKLWRSLETIQAAGADLLYHDFAFVFPDGRHERYDLSGWSLERWRAGERFSIPPSTWLFRSGLVEFCENYATGEDPEFLRRHWHRLRTAHLAEVLSRYHVHDASLSQRGMCRVVTGQLKGLSFADVAGCSDVPALPAG